MFTGPEALKSLSAAARAEILELFPELEDLAYQPVPARALPSGKMARHLTARHVKNGKLLLAQL